MIKAIVTWLRKQQMDPVERYLSESTDLVDLENRQRDLARKGIWL